MSKIYWDTMLFIYWLEDREPYCERVDALFRRMQERGDRLVTSVFTIAELLVAPKKQQDKALEEKLLSFLKGPEIDILPFDFSAAERYAQIRATGSVTPADSIHLACAAASGVDLFLTHDDRVRRMVVPGIQFIDGIETNALGLI